MKTQVTLLLSFILLNLLSCSQENEIDNAIAEAMREEADVDPSVDGAVSIRYFSEDRER